MLGELNVRRLKVKLRWTVKDAVGCDEALVGTRAVSNSRSARRRHRHVHLEELLSCIHRIGLCAIEYLISQSPDEKCRRAPWSPSRVAASADRIARCQSKFRRPKLVRRSSIPAPRPSSNAHPILFILSSDQYQQARRRGDKAKEWCNQVRKFFNRRMLALRASPKRASFCDLNNHSHHARLAGASTQTRSWPRPSQQTTP